MGIAEFQQSPLNISIMSDISLLKKIKEFKSPWCYQYQRRLDTIEEDKKNLEHRKKSLSFIENRLVNKTEDNDLKDLIDAFDFEYLFYQELTDDTSWLPDFNRKQPFSNKLSKTIWHWKTGFEI